MIYLETITIPFPKPENEYQKLNFDEEQFRKISTESLNATTTAQGQVS